MHKIKEYETHMEMFLSLPKGGVGAEVGVCKGFNSVLLWHTLKPSKMHLCDIWEERPYDTYLIENPELWYDDHSALVGKLFGDEVKNGSVELHKEYGGNFLYGLENDSLDWVYLDSLHDYKTVQIEIDNALYKVKKGGIIMGHDYMSHPQVWRTGVIRAVNDFIQDGKMRMIGITIQKYPSWMCEVL